MKKKALTPEPNFQLTCPHCRGTVFKPKWDGGWATHRNASGWLARFFGINYPDRLEVTCRGCGETSWLPSEAMKYLKKLTQVD